MLITLDEAKNWLKVDYDDENEEIQSLIDTAEYFLYKKTNKHFKTNPAAKLFCKMLIAEWFKDRGLMQDYKVTAKIKPYLISLLIDLQYCNKEEL